MIVQHNIGSAQQDKTPKYLTCAHQTKDSTSAPDKKKSTLLYSTISIFENIMLK